MLREEIVGNSYAGGAVDDVDKSVGATSKVAMIDPYIGGVEYVDGVAVGAAAVAEMGGGIPDNSRLPGLTIMDANTMYDHVANMLHCYARAVSNFHFCPSPIYGFVTIYHQLIVELDHHALSENNPQWFGLDHAVTERSRLRFRRVVGRVRDHVHRAGFPSDGIPAEPHRAVGQGAAVGGPIGLTSPTRIYRVHGLVGCFIIAIL